MRLPLPLLAVLTFAMSVLAKESGTAAPEAKPRIEVCFVLDTTSSMTGLIEGAKQKIWSIANQFIAAKPAPELKFGLVAFRDRGDEYVVRTHPLTDDIDTIYAKLREFRAEGGGDMPESVNEGLDAAVRQMKWSKDDRTLKIIFLVGDAPPHMDYANGPKYPDICHEALRRGIVINTVQCGNIADTTPFWKEIAKLSEGEYLAIAQDGGMTVTSTPMDDKLAELNRRLGTTLVPYGDDKDRAAVRSKQALAEAAPAAAASDRLSFNAATGKAVQGGGEFLDELAAGRIKPGDIEPAKLPAEIAKLPTEERQARLDTLKKERTEVQNEIAQLAQERGAFIAKEQARLAAEGKADAFDAKIGETLRAQSAKHGIPLTR
jgi:Mg-chelatase subunit ChlD